MLNPISKDQIGFFPISVIIIGMGTTPASDKWVFTIRIIQLDSAIWIYQKARIGKIKSLVTIIKAWPDRLYGTQILDSNRTLDHLRPGF